MKRFQCSRCGKVFDRKFNYERHINDTKKVCLQIPILKVVDPPLFQPVQQIQPYQSQYQGLPIHVIPQTDIYNLNELKCENCGKEYSTKSNLNKHLKKCILPGKASDINRQKEDLYKERIQHLEAQILELTKKIGNNYNYQFTQHLDQSVHQQNIQINSYGNENLNYITPSEVEKLISQPATCLPQFIKLVHYNEEHPENHNVVIDEIKENVIKTLKDKSNWQHSGFEEFVERFAIEKYDQLCDLYNSDEVNVDEVVREKFDKWADQFDYVESNTRKKAEEDAKLAIILGSKWLRDKKITKRGLKRILDGEMILKEEDMIEVEKIKKKVGWGQNIPLNKIKSITDGSKISSVNLPNKRL